MQARCNRLRPWSLVLGLALLTASFGPTVSAQMELDPAQLEQLESLGPEERLRLLEEMRRARAEQGSPQDSVRTSLPLDDAFAPRPIGGEPEDLQTTGEEPPAAPLELERFGQSLFDLSPETFEPRGFGPVPADYRIGPGDELVVEVWGEVSFRDSYRVGREGAVLLRDAGRANVAGLTLEKAREEITRRLARVLSGVQPEGGGSTYVDVTLGRLRAIRVFVIGEASRPGGYELSSAATVFQALYAAGGPNDIGSMRRVELVRNNRRQAQLDLYAYLTEGRREGDLILQDGDTVFIPVAQTSVGVRGEVRRPGLFELIEGEGLRDLVRFAGGLKPSGRADLAHVRRVLPPSERGADGVDRVELDLSLAGVFDPGRPVERLHDGDEVEVLAVNERDEAFVSVGGSVVSPGRYGYHPGMRLSELLARAKGPWRDAILDRAVLVRVRDDYSRESHPVDLGALSEGSLGDLMLSPMDSLHVFSQEILQADRELTIHGDVRRPGAFPYFENMTLRDLILAAGGLKESADMLVAEVGRLELDVGHEDSLATVMRIPLGKGAASPEAGRFVLQNHDHVFVRRQPGWELQRNVTLSGEVAYPGVYTLLHREERLSSVIERAGGLMESAYPLGFRLRRVEGGAGNIGLDLRHALEHPGEANDIILMAGDEITIPPIPMSVKVIGEVGYPTSVVYEKGKSIGDYVDHAGGYTSHADEGRTKVVYPNGLSAKVRRWWPDPGVRPGSVIYVPRKDPEAGIEWGGVLRDTTQILASLATIYLVIDRTN